MRKCKHCLQSKANRPRGLCWSCYYTPGVRERYPLLSGVIGSCGVNQNVDFNGPAKPTERPTQALGGSEEKMSVLQQRAARGESLFHAEDNPLCVLQRTAGLKVAS